MPEFANTQNDLGKLSPNDSIGHVRLLLKRPPARQQAFDVLMTNLYDPNSSLYHHWLTPAEIGENYGPSESDLAQISRWLSSQGLSVEDVSPAKTVITFTGPASRLESAFSTELHRYRHDTESKISISVDPSIPIAAAPIIEGVIGLSTLKPKPMISFPHTPPAGQSSPLLYAGKGPLSIFAADFNAIYDLNFLYAFNINGAGTTIAILGDSRVANSDIEDFEALAGLPIVDPTVVIPPLGSDPLTTNDDQQAEATLDVERVIGTAPGAKVDLVVSADDANGAGLDLAAQYVINQNLAQIVSISFGSCEITAGKTATLFYDKLFAQAAAQGISVFVSSGDSAAAACQPSGTLPPLVQAVKSINYICASSYATCVGGTEFVEGSGNYWTGPKTTAVGYIPEGAWNDSTDNVIAGTGGGASQFIAKPSWQSGIGVPADGERDTPDVAFSASSNHDPYAICAAFEGSSCATGTFFYVGGTSAAAPSMAGIQALTNQRGGKALGNINPLLYGAAALTTGNPFHDVTPATSGVKPCVITTPSLCNNSTSGPPALLTAGTQGYAVTAGYDAVTGLGSLDGLNWASAANGKVRAITTLTLSADTAIVGYQQASSAATFTATIVGSRPTSPNGMVIFTPTCLFCTGQDTPVTVSVVPVNGVAIAKINFPTSTNVKGGIYSVTATFSGDLDNVGSMSPSVVVTYTGGADGDFQSQTYLYSQALQPFGVVAQSQTFALSAYVTNSLNLTGLKVPYPTPAGYVEFLIDGVFSRSAVGNLVAVPNSLCGYISSLSCPSSSATIQVTANTLGDHQVLALYTGGFTAGTPQNPDGTMHSGDISFSSDPSGFFTVVPVYGAQTITFRPIPSQIVSSLTLTATASSGLVVTFSSSTPTTCSLTDAKTLALTNSGTCTVVASQAGNVSYSPAPSVTQSFSVVSQQKVQLSITSEVVGPAAGAGFDYVTLLTNYSPYEAFWNATTSATWIHLTIASGTTSGSATFTYDANPGATRTGSIVFNNASATLAITQSGSSYVPGGVVTTLVSSGLSQPFGIAVDSIDDVYIADAGNNALKEWDSTKQQVVTLLASGLNYPAGVANSNGFIYVADTGNNEVKTCCAAVTGQPILTVSSGLNTPFALASLNTSGSNYYIFIADTNDSAIKEAALLGNPTATVTPTTLVSSGLNAPLGVAVDSFGNVYIADTFNNAVKEWDASTQQVTTLVSGLSKPIGIAVDLTGNLYIADSGNNAIKEWSAATKTVSTLVSTGLSNPHGVAVDKAGNLFIADFGNNAVKKVALGYLSTANFNEPAAAGTDQMLPVMPASLVLNAASDQSWVNITSQTNGVVAFSFSANTSASSRTAHITVLGQIVTVTQVPQNGLASQTINFIPIGAQAAGAPLSLTASASSGLTVNFSAAPSSVCTAYGSSVTFYAAGTCSVTASQPGNVNYAPAPPVTQNFPVATSVAMGFVPISPCRAVDTRSANGPFGGPIMSAGSFRNFLLPSSKCFLPANALAYSVNVTVVPQTTLGYLTIWPTGQTRPLVSTLNSLDGRIVANAAIVPADAYGSVSVYVTDQTQVIVDINGYFTTDPTALTFVPVSPCRIADTRNAVSPFGGPSLVPNYEYSRIFPVPYSACSIPDTASAYSFNATVVPPGQLQFLTLLPTDVFSNAVEPPAYSTLNSYNGQVVANAAIVPAGTSGAVAAFVTDQTDFLLDINGYFTSTPPSPLAFHTVPPCRIADTRNANGTFGGPILAPNSIRAFPVPTSGCNIPAGSTAYALNVTAVPSGPLNYLTLWPDGQTQPNVSTLNSYNGQIVANMALVPAGNNGSIDVFVTDQTHVILDIVGYFSPQ